MGRVDDALEAALAGGPHEPLFDAIERASGLPGPRPNVLMMRSVGERAGKAGASGAELVDAMLADRRQALFRTGLYAVAARAARGDRRAWNALHDLADETAKERRDAVGDALSEAIAASGDAAIDRLEAFLDGYLHAHVALEAITAPRALERLSRGPDVAAILARAFDLADEAPRAADRLQGVRLLREGLPRQIARLAPRFQETFDVIDARLERERPETREVLDQAITALRKVIGEAAADRLRARLRAHDKAPRDPSRIVKGTRKRSRGR